MVGLGWLCLGGSLYPGPVALALAPLDANTKGLPGSWALSPGAQNKVSIHEDPSFLSSPLTHCGAGGGLGGQREGYDPLEGNERSNSHVKRIRATPSARLLLFP